MNPNYVTFVKQNIQIVSNKIYTTCRRSHLVVTNSGSSQEEWKIHNLCRVKKIECNHQKNPHPLPSTYEVHL